MSFQDEQIQRIIKNQQKTEEAAEREFIQIREGDKVKIGGESFTFEKLSLFNENISILCPKELEEMPEKYKKLKYPSEHRPQVILCDKSTTVNLCFNHTVHHATNDMLEGYLENAEATINQMAPNPQVIGKEMLQAINTPITLLEFKARALDSDLYNCISYCSLKNRLLMISFNCLSRQHYDWEPYIKQIMQSVEINEDLENNDEPSIDREV